MRYVFADCALDTRLYTVQRAGQTIQLRPKVFQVLCYLLEHRNRVVSKDELCTHVWPEQFISDATIASTLRTVRQALGDRGRTQGLIQTLRGHGYRLVAAVQESPEVAPDTLADMDEPGSAGESGGGTPPVVACPDSTAVSILEPASRGAGERKLVTVLCGAPGSATFDMTRPAVHHAAWATTAREIVAHYGGTLLPTVDATLLAVFGLPVAYEDHAQRAVLAALRLQQALQTPPSSTVPEAAATGRLGLHTGPVAVGSVGEAASPATVVMGETLTQATKLQACAAPGTILCSAATARLVRGLVRLAVVDRAFAAEPVFQLRGPRPQRLRGGRGRPQPVSPLVGRAPELATLQALLARAAAGQGQVVGIVGEAGLGKSRLVAEFRRTLRRRRLTYLTGHCVAWGQASPYGPVVDILRQAWGLKGTDPPVTIARRVRQQFTTLGLSPEEGVLYVATLLGGALSTAPLATQSPQAVRARTIAQLLQLVLQEARQQPLVLEVENLHWLDPSSAEVLAALVERLAGAAILLLTTYRSGYSPMWLEKSYATQLALGRLTPADSQRIVLAIQGPMLVAEPLVRAIITKASGNPLFVEELAHATVEQGVAQLPEAVPVTLQNVLTARLDRLPWAAKHVVQVAAVIGPEVAVAVLEAVLEWPAQALQESLSHLQMVEFLYETGLTPARHYTFKHVLTQEAAYQTLLLQERQELHARIAQVLATRFPDTATAQPELVAHHYTAAGLGALAIPYWQQAGQRASQHLAYVEAVSHLTQALALLATLPETTERWQQELDLQLALGPALMASRGSAAPDVEQAYGRARALCAQLGDTPELFSTLMGLWRFYLNRGPLATARALAEQLDRLAQRAATPAQRLVACHTLGDTLFYLGDYAAARTHLERGIAMIDPTAEQGLALRHGAAPGVACLVVAAWTLWCLGYPAQAVQRSQEALALAQTLAHPVSLAIVQHYTAFLHRHRRDTSAVQTQAEALQSLATAQELPLWAGLGTGWRGWVLAMQGEGAAGLTQIQQGVADVLSTGQMAARPRWLLLLAEVAGHTGRVEVGLRWLAEGLAALQASGHGDMLAEAYRLQGELLLRQVIPATVQAEACFQRALAVACQQQAKSWELRAALSLARLWQQQGKGATAQALLAPVYNWFTEGFETADLQEAKALLETLEMPQACAR